MKGVFVPDRGDIVWPDFHPQTGREQSGRRPALVLSPARYNAKTSLCLTCPITSKVKGYPFEVSLPPELAVQGVVLSDQIRSLDWNARRASLACHAPPEVLAQVTAKASLLISD